MRRVRESYFITTRTKKYARGCRPKRTTDGGVWKSVDRDHPIVDKCGNPVGGVWKTLVYQQGSGIKKQKTNWTIKEYRLGEPGERKFSESGEKNSNEWNPLMLDGVVLCKFYNNKLNKHPSGTEKNEAVVQ